MKNGIEKKRKEKKKNILQLNINFPDHDPQSSGLYQHDFCLNWFL